MRNILVLLFLICLSYQDIKTYYISKIWILPSLGLICLFSNYDMGNVLASLLFSIPAFIFYKSKGWMGSADVCFLALFGFILGWQRMIVCMYVSIFLGFVWFLVVRKKLCPFLACLSMGFYISLWKGYTIFYWILTKIG